MATNPTTVQDLELASSDKLWEGLELLVAGRVAGGVYLLGYVAEMVLKSACLLLRGALPSDEAWSRIRPIRTLGNLSKIKHENYHSLPFWCQALATVRAVAGKPPLPAQFGRELYRRVVRIHGTWDVAMRYYPDGQVLPNESSAVYYDVEWIYNNRLKLRV
jgi:hypothetical protein